MPIKSNTPNPARSLAQRKGRSVFDDVPNGFVGYILALQPATDFDFQSKSSAGALRVMSLERGALESTGATPTAIDAFRTEAYPPTAATDVGFFTSPDSVSMSAQAFVWVQGSVPGDTLVCTSLGSWNGLAVTFTLSRENADGSINQILKETINDAQRHAYPIP